TALHAASQPAAVVLRDEEDDAIARPKVLEAPRAAAGDEARLGADGRVQLAGVSCFRPGPIAGVGLDGVGLDRQRASPEVDTRQLAGEQAGGGRAGGLRGGDAPRPPSE